MAESVISVAGLRKSYGELEAVRGIDLEVAAGGIRVPGAERGGQDDHGGDPRGLPASAAPARSAVLGADPAGAGRAGAQRIGIVLQDCNMQPELTVRESLELYAGYYDAPASVDETIELVGLSDEADDRGRGASPAASSAGWTSALALVGDPELLFLDEPTTGFDPSARRQAWEVIASLRDLGKTVFLTTHYMDEAQALADRVAIIADGRIVAEGAPGELGGRERRRPRSASGSRRGSAAADLPGGRGRARRAPGAANGEVAASHRGPGRDPQRAHRLGAGARPRPGRAGGAPAEPRGRVPGADRADDAGERGRNERRRARPAPVPLRPEDLLAQPRDGVLHRDVPGHVPGPPRRDRQRRRPLEQLGGIDATTYYVPAIITLAVVSATMSSLAMSLTIRARERDPEARLGERRCRSWVFIAGPDRQRDRRSRSDVRRSWPRSGEIAVRGPDPVGSRLPAVLVTLAVGAASFCLPRASP